MAIISSVLKLVNVGDAVSVDSDTNDEKEENAMFGKSSEGDNQAPDNDIIGKILEQISNPEEIFKYYPSTPETMLKSSKEEQDDVSYYIEFAKSKDGHGRFFNMTENDNFNTQDEGSNFPSNKIQDKRSFSEKFKEKFKNKFPSKNKTGYEGVNPSEKASKGAKHEKKLSFSDIKERVKKCSENTKSWLETKVLSQVKKRGLSLEAVKLQIKQLPLIVMSLVGAVMTGMIAPGFALLLSEILKVTADPKRLEAERFKWAFKFVDLGVFIAIGSTVQKFATSLTESRLEMGLKENNFNSAMNETKTPKKSSPVDSRAVSPEAENIILDEKLEPEGLHADKVEKFDLHDEQDLDVNSDKFRQKDENLNLIDGTSDTKAEKMTDKMDVDASVSKNNAFSISNLTSKVSGSISTFMTMFISFTNGWKMTLVVLAGLPIIAYAQSVQDGEPEETKKEEDGIISKLWKKVRGASSSASSKLPSDYYSSKYKDDCLKPYRYAVKLLVASGLAFAIAECVTFLVYAGALRYGGYLVRVGEMTVESVMTVLMTVLFGGAGSSNTPAEKTKTSKSNNAEKEQLNDVKVDDKIDDDKLVKIDDVNGDVEFHNVELHHPEKKNSVMSGLNISIKPSETLAIIGTTDFNSNSVIALVERFYDPSNGFITLDNVDIRTLDVRWLRSQTALVSERAILDHHSVADNLLLGVDIKNLTNDEVADILTDEHLKCFISSLSKTYYSLVNDDVVINNTTKQKLVIARALLRNPRILIIDEFSQSNEVVEDSLKRLRLGKTCIIFPRRLSTLEKADKIVIVYHGKVVEQGLRKDLLKRKGIYYHLINTKLYSDVVSEL